ncbi:hypothetical protein [Blastomonas sp. CCH1-A6]|jgi:hypothetical protein|uniref:hypothetical protein n=1 Tax=Blastomonas sp. CCH1-A6 TaxID=1768762 RepID=UPI000835162C
MAKPLDARIASALSQDARAATVADLIDELAAQIDATKAEHDRLDAISKSATASEDEAEAAADEVTKLARRMVRLEAKREQLRARHADLLASDRRKAATDRHTAAKARRDELVADLRREVPGLLDKLVEFLVRIEASEAECQGLGNPGYGLEMLESAEALARGCASHWRNGFGSPITRLTQMRIPEFDASTGARNLWPVPHNPMASVQQAEAAERQRRHLEQERRLAETKTYRITPPETPGFQAIVETQTGKKRVTSSSLIARMTPAQAGAARTAGLAVEPAPDGQTIGMPQSGAFLS